MAKSVRYYAEFKSQEDNLYRIEILQDGSYSAQEIVLADNPVVIDWGNVDKLEPVMSSSATLRLVSMTDRQFVDMYTVEATAIMLNVYRNGSLYWSGTLDTELFEEPYSMLDRYVTELTFSDFAPLSRLKWQMTGFASMREVINECLRISDIEYNDTEEYVSTKIENSVVELLDDAILSMDNFYDEDGEAWNVREVLDETLRPFALRLKQKGGKIIIADINALSALTPQNVEWRANDSMLGVEPTYNRAVINFSPYSETVLFDGSFDYDEILKNKDDIEETLGIVTPDALYLGFTMQYGAEYDSLTRVQGLNIGGGARVFKITQEEDGEDTAGVMWGVRPADGDWKGRSPIGKHIDYPYTSGCIIQSDRFPVKSGSQDYKLAISVEVLYDVRRNPYEQAGDNNEEGNWERFVNWANYGAIPVKLVVYGQNGQTYSFDNRDVYGNDDDIDAWYGEWIEGDSGTMWLEFYDHGNRTSNTGFGGWQKNKQSIGFWSGSLPPSMTLHIDSEKIPLPPISGNMQFSIYAGVLARDNNNNEQYPDVAGISRWLLYRNPKISIVKHSGKEIDAEDVEVSAWINKAAEREVSVDTYIGSAHSRIPMAKGVVMQNSNNNTPVKKFTRAGVTDTLENLLLGTLYSNYATRKNTLSGTIRLVATEQILSDTFCVNDGFMILQENQNLKTESSQVIMAEIAEDNYTGIEYGADI